MNKIVHCLLSFGMIALFSGCVHFPTATNDISYSTALKPGDVIEIAIDAAREVKFPPATKIDKASGIVEFGNYTMPEIGITAQVRIKSEGQLEVTVKRGSPYIPLDVNGPAGEFKAKLSDLLRQAGDKAGK